jgi:hypothetical protein
LSRNDFAARQSLRLEDSFVAESGLPIKFFLFTDVVELPLVIARRPIVVHCLAKPVVNPLTCSPTFVKRTGQCTTGLSCTPMQLGPQPEKTNHIFNKMKEFRFAVPGAD